MQHRPSSEQLCQDLDCHWGRIRLSEQEIEYLKIGLTFLGTLLGAIIGAPVVERIKDRLLAKRQWIVQRNEIVNSIRLIMGIFGAFDQLRVAAFGPRGSGTRVTMDASSLVPIIQFSASAFQRLSKFDLSLVDPVLAKLSALHPDESQKSAVAQRLITHLLVTKANFLHLQTFEPISMTDVTTRTESLCLSDQDTQSIQVSDEEYDGLLIFLEGLYAPRLGIKSFSLTADREIISAEFAILRARADYASMQFEMKLQDYTTKYGDKTSSAN
jgi:hypothetical protein